MNKLEFVNKLSCLCGLSKVECNRFLKITYFLICDSLNKGEEICFKGIGKLFVKTRKERFLKNGNKQILISSKNIPAFKIGKNFKDIIK